ncbi:cytochrome b5 [Mycena amicta]|nr:cytochrome b5 [Mycena amicta]
MALSDFLSVAKYSLVVLFPLLILLNRSYIRSSTRQRMIREAELEAEKEQEKEKQPKTIMQPARDDLAPPKDDPFTLAQLVEYAGSEDVTRPIYLSIKGTVFDVSRNRAVYGPGASYNIFAGKDASKGLGMSSLKDDDALPDYSGLDEKDMKVLDDWYTFFIKRYNIVGKVIDHPTLLAEQKAAEEAEREAVVEESTSAAA